MAQRPSAVIEPAPVVRRADRAEAEEIAGRPLEPARRRMKRRHGGKRAALAGDVDESRARRRPRAAPCACGPRRPTGSRGPLRPRRACAPASRQAASPER